MFLLVDRQFFFTCALLMHCIILHNASVACRLIFVICLFRLRKHSPLDRSFLFGAEIWRMRRASSAFTCATSSGTSTRRTSLLVYLRHFFYCQLYFTTCEDIWDWLSKWGIRKCGKVNVCRKDVAGRPAPTHCSAFLSFVLEEEATCFFTCVYNLFDRACRYIIPIAHYLLLYVTRLFINLHVATKVLQFYFYLFTCGLYLHLTFFYMCCYFVFYLL